MTDPSAEYAILLGPDAEPGTAVQLHLPEGAGVEKAAEAVDGLLAADPTVETISLFVGGEPIGLTSRSFLGTEPAPDGSGQRSYGAGDGAALPGESLRYVPVRYSCSTTGCGQVVFRAFYDAADVPACDLCGRHMELAQ